MAATVQDNDANTANIARVCNEMLKDESRHPVRINCNNSNLHLIAGNIILKPSLPPSRFIFFISEVLLKMKARSKRTTEIYIVKEIYFWIYLQNNWIILNLFFCYSVYLASFLYSIPVDK